MLTILLAFVWNPIYQKLQGIQVDGYAKRAARSAACYGIRSVLPECYDHADVHSVLQDIRQTVKVEAALLLPNFPPDLGIYGSLRTNLRVPCTEKWTAFKQPMQIGAPDPAVSTNPTIPLCLLILTYRTHEKTRCGACPDRRTSDGYAGCQCNSYRAYHSDRVAARHQSPRRAGH